MSHQGSAAETRRTLSDRIERIEISGTSAVVNDVARLRAQGISLVDLGAGEPHFSTPQHIKDAAIDAIKRDFTKYTAVPGTHELRDAITARHAQDFGSDYRRNECLASAGGKLALFTALEVLVNSGDEVIIPVPYWVSFRDIARFAGAKCVFVDTRDREEPEVARAFDTAISPRTKAIILNSPNNPSGAVLSANSIRAVIEMAQQRGVYTICDECYVYLTYDVPRFSAGSLKGSKDHIIIIGSLSKTYAMTGWRLGYALGPAPIIAAMQKLQSQTISCPPSISQIAAIASLNGPQDCIKEMHREYGELRECAYSLLHTIDGVECDKPQGAFYLFPNVASVLRRLRLRSARELTQTLLEQAHVVVIPGDIFGASEHVRISYAVARSDLEQGLTRIKELLSAYPH